MNEDPVLIGSRAARKSVRQLVRSGDSPAQETGAGQPRGVDRD
jgi:hypothetical protein